MAKTINKDIDIFTNFESAMRSFVKEKSADLLKTKDGSYYIDRSKTALSSWPNLYTKINTK